MPAILIIAMIAVLVEPASGQPRAPATQPSTAPAPTILILPFADPTGSMGRTLQQDLAASLTGLTRARILAPCQAPVAMDNEQALSQARESNADMVVFAQVQHSPREVRVTGQVLDASSGKALAGLKATAPANNLFPMEDALAGQVAAALQSGLVAPAATQPAGNQPQAAAPEYQSYTYPETVRSLERIPPAGSYYSYAYPSYRYVYGYPEYDYFGPYYGPDFFFFGNYYYFGHRHDHDHDWDGFRPHGFHDHGSFGHGGFGAGHPGRAGAMPGGGFGGAAGHSGGGGGHGR